MEKDADTPLFHNTTHSTMDYDDDDHNDGGYGYAGGIGRY
jgi:hypothetical protein